MSQEIDQQEMAMRYLLGTLSEDEKTRLEEQYFLDDTEFEQLEIAEDELIDRYVRTELSADDASRFEKLLSSPRLYERVEVARMIAKRADAPSPKQEVNPTPVIRTPQLEPRRVSWWQTMFGPGPVASPAFRPAMAFGLVFMLLTTLALVFVWMKLRTESQRLAQEQQQREELARKIDEQTARSGKLEEQLNQTRRERDEQQQLAEEYKRLAQEQQRTQQGFTFAFLLIPGGGSRSVDNPSPAVQSFTVPSGATAVSLTLNVTDGDDNYARYNAIVRNIDTGKEISRPNLKPTQRQGRKYITFKLDAKVLPPGTYNVRVDGIDSSGQAVNFEDYPFRVRAASR